jgi:hypothetical protein
MTKQYRNGVWYRMPDMEGTDIHSDVINVGGRILVRTYRDSPGASPCMEVLVSTQDPDSVMRNLLGE